MRTRRLRTRFILAGTTLVLTTVGSGVWSIWTFARLSAVVGRTLEDSQAVVDLTTALAGSLEREDDALLLALSGNVDLAAKQLTRDRRRGEEQYQQLVSTLTEEEVDERTLRRQMGPVELLVQPRLFRRRRGCARSGTVVPLQGRQVLGNDW